jgi:TPP-dependent pyruvate/acetoin dehydrogenase alpha subunit
MIFNYCVDSTLGRATRIRHLSFQVASIMRLINKRKFAAKSKTPLHLAFGHETVGAGIALVRSEFDPLILTHRNIHINIATCIVDSPRLLPALINQAVGVDQYGQYKDEGSMNMLPLGSSSVNYTSSILANGLPVGLGILSGVVRSCHNEVCAWLQVGDGSMEEGAFYESLILAKSFSLPAIFMVENNGWSLGTSISERRTDISLSSLAESLDVFYTKIDTTVSPVEFYNKLESLRSDVLSSMKPVIVEVEVRAPILNVSADGRCQFYHHGTI